MKVRFALLLPVLPLLPLLLCQCHSDAWCSFLVLSTNAAYAVGSHYAGPLAGSPPDTGRLYRDCIDGVETPVPNDPTEEAAALSPPEGACTKPVSTDDPCVRCATTRCCTESMTCFAEGTCTCLMGRATPGVVWPESVKCGAEDAAYTAEIACISDHCAKECLQ